MHFVHRPGLGFLGAFFAGFHPCVVFPLMVVRPDDRSGAGRRFPFAGEGIAFIEVHTGIRLDMVFINRSLAQPRNKPFPDAATVPARVQHVAVGVPLVEIAGDGHPLCIGRPDGEVNAAFAMYLYRVTAHFFIQAKVFAALQERNIEISE